MRVLTDKRTGSWLPRGRGNRRKVDWEFGISKLLIYRMGFPGGSEGKASARNAGDLGLIPGLGRSPGEGHGNPTPVFLPGESHEWRSLVGYI